MEWQTNFVMENGELNSSVIIKRESLETLSGERTIERVYIAPNVSFIYKRFANMEQGYREIWIQEKILSSFPNFYPKMIAKSFSTNSSWIAYEDLGNIKHEFTYQILNEVAKHIAWWHSLPVGKWKNVPLNGPKPKIEAIKTDLLRNKNVINDLFSTENISPKNMGKFFSLLEKWEFSKKNVLSHGDLHLGNYGTSKNKLVILDWEYVHLNTRFWDLYHLIDLSHPLYPKTVPNDWRNQILTKYFEHVQTFGIETDLDSFKTEYYVFSATFSLWMMILIKNDLKRQDQKLPETALKNQLKETVKNFIQCTNML